MANSRRERSTGQTVTRARKEGGRRAMPVVVKNTPPGHHWGWYSREDTRMHLQTVDRQHNYKVWLEEKGKRVFEPVGKIPAKVVKALQEAVTDRRVKIEDNWVDLMLDKGWIELHVALPEITLIAYPNTPSQFTRKIDLLSWFSQEQLETLKPEAIELNRMMASLRLWADRPEEGTRYDVRLSRLLWTD